MESLAHDVRHALRSLARSPAFVVLSVLCLAIGIGANTTVFSVVNGLLLQALPFTEPERLVIVGETPRGSPTSAGRTSYPVFVDLKEQGADVAEMAAMRLRDVALADDDRVDRNAAAFISWNLLPMLGVEPLAGRALREDEARTGAAPVVLLGETLWRQRFAADHTVIGRPILVDGVARTVVGIVPRFAQPTVPGPLRAARLWLPLAPENAAPRDERSLIVLARLHRVVAPEVARTRLAAVGTELARQYAEHEGWTMTVQPLARSISASTRTLLLLMMGAVTFVLLIACANVANLMLARATARRREIAIRSALGASRGRIVRRMVTESLIVGLASVPFGVLIASWGLHLLLRTGPGQTTDVELPIDARVLAFTIAVATLTSLVFGLAPALHAARGATRDALTASGGGSTGGRPQKRLRNALVVAEVAMSVVLLVGASLFVRSFLHLLRLETGFDTSAIATMRFEIPRDRSGSGEEITRRVEMVVERLAALPGVRAIAASDILPLRDGGAHTPVILEGSGVAPDAAPAVLAAGVTSGFFDALDMPVLRGRGFTEAESRRQSYVAVINERMAGRLWPDQDALGRRFRVASDTTGGWFTVIGISRDLANWDLSNRALPTAYLPFAHAPIRDPRLVIRSSGDPLAVIAPARAALRSIDPTLAVFQASSMEEIHRGAFWKQRMFGGTLGAFGIVAIVLAAVGLYGVLSYLVSQRTREIGVRMALGAERRDVVGMVVRQGLGLVVAGVILGLPAALAAARIARGQLHGVSAADPVSFAGVALLLIAVGLVASHRPASRAAAVSPAASMRE